MAACARSCQGVASLLGGGTMCCLFREDLGCHVMPEGQLVPLTRAQSLMRHDHAHPSHGGLVSLCVPMRPPPPKPGQPAQARCRPFHFAEGQSGRRGCSTEHGQKWNKLSSSPSKQACLQACLRNTKGLGPTRGPSQGQCCFFRADLGCFIVPDSEITRAADDRGDAALCHRATLPPPSPGGSRQSLPPGWTARAHPSTGQRFFEFRTRHRPHTLGSGWSRDGVRTGAEFWVFRTFSKPDREPEGSVEALLRRRARDGPPVKLPGESMSRFRARQHEWRRTTKQRQHEARLRANKERLKRRRTAQAESKTPHKKQPHKQTGSGPNWQCGAFTGHDMGCGGGKWEKLLEPVKNEFFRPPLKHEEAKCVRQCLARGQQPLKALDSHPASKLCCFYRADLGCWAIMGGGVTAEAGDKGRSTMCVDLAKRSGYSRFAEPDPDNKAADAVPVPHRHIAINAAPQDDDETEVVVDADGAQEPITAEDGAQEPITAEEEPDPAASSRGFVRRRGRHKQRRGPKKKHSMFAPVKARSNAALFKDATTALRKRRLVQTLQLLSLCVSAARKSRRKRVRRRARVSRATKELRRCLSLRARVHGVMGEFQRGVSDLERLLDTIGQDRRTIKKLRSFQKKDEMLQQVFDAKAGGEFGQCAAGASALLAGGAIESVRLYLLRAECMFASESFAAVLMDCKRVLLVERFNARALHFIARATFEVSVDVEKTKKVCLYCLRVQPDHAGCSALFLQMKILGRKLTRAKTFLESSREIKRSIAEQTNKTNNETKAQVDFANAQLMQAVTLFREVYALQDSRTVGWWTSERPLPHALFTRALVTACSVHMELINSTHWDLRPVPRPAWQRSRNETVVYAAEVLQECERAARSVRSSEASGMLQAPEREMLALLHMARATAFLRMDKPKLAAAELTRAQSARPNLAFSDNDLYRSTFRALHEGIGQARRRQEEEKREKERLKNVDYYKVLGVPENASFKDIQRAYRKLALKWHPDKAKAKTDAEQKEAEEIFLSITDAYEVLNDPTMRLQWDMGHGVDSQWEGSDELKAEQHRLYEEATGGRGFEFPKWFNRQGGQGDREDEEGGDDDAFDFSGDDVEVIVDELRLRVEPLPEHDHVSCNHSCWYKSRRLSCFMRYRELMKLKDKTRRAAIRDVDSACVGQCSCADPWVHVWKRSKKKRTRVRKIRTSMERLHAKHKLRPSWSKTTHCKPHTCLSHRPLKPVPPPPTKASTRSSNGAVHFDFHFKFTRGVTMAVLVEGVPATEEAVCRVAKLLGRVETDTRGVPVFTHRSPYDIIEDRADVAESIRVDVVPPHRPQNSHDGFALEEGAWVHHMSVVICAVPFPRSCRDLDFAECSVAMRFPPFETAAHRSEDNLRSEARLASLDAQERSAQDWEEGMDEDEPEPDPRDRGWVLVRRVAPMPYEVQFATFLFTGTPLGIHFATRPDDRGAVVKAVKPKSRADNLDVEQGMHLVSVDGEECEDELLTSIMRMLRDAPFAPHCELRFRRPARYHPAKDDLFGTDKYGPPVGDMVGQGDQSQSEHSFSVRFDFTGFDQVMLATGDASKWVVLDSHKLQHAIAAARDAVAQEYRINLIAERSHVLPYSHPVALLCSKRQPSAPVISIFDDDTDFLYRMDTERQDALITLYAEGDEELGQISAQNNRMSDSFLEDVQGLNVWIRKWENGAWATPL